MNTVAKPDRIGLQATQIRLTCSDTVGLYS